MAAAGSAVATLVVPRVASALVRPGAEASATRQGADTLTPYADVTTYNNYYYGSNIN